MHLAGLALRAARAHARARAAVALLLACGRALRRIFALGLAKASGLPVAVACTSGTAAAELLPAAIEAYEARVPLLLLTADRPAELRENGAGQAIDQLKLYGGAAKWFFEVGTHDASEERVRWMRTLACRAYWTALESRPGIVHLNFPLREPLVSDEPLPADDTARPEDRPYVRRAPTSVPDAGVDIEDEAWLRELAAASRRGVVVAGRDERDGSLGSATAASARRPAGRRRRPAVAGRRGEAGRSLRRAAARRGIPASHRRHLALLAGDLLVSSRATRLASLVDNVRQVALDPESAWQDPASVLSDSLELEPRRR